MSRGAVIAGAVVLVAAAAAVGLATRATGPTARVEAGVIRERVIAEARVVPVDGTAEIGAVEGGRALSVLVREGDRVEAGQLLAELGPEDKRVRVTSPIAGAVLARRVDVGDTVPPQSAAPLFEIADPARTELRLEIDEPVSDRVAEGLAVTVVGPGGRDAIGEATVRRVGDRLEPRTVSPEEGRGRGEGWVRAAWATWKGAPPKLPLGRHVEAIVHRGDKKVAARVPRCAATVRDGRAVVDEAFLLWTREVPVELGASDDGFVEVTGAAAGTVVRCR